MSTTAIVLIILLVLGVVASNIMLLKYSAKFKFPTQETDQQKQTSQEQKQEQD